MQSEGGAAGAMHGALQGGALSTTFTASQGLLLMIPNMYKIAGELTSTVLHVAARSLAAQGLSIFGDHQDVMAVRQTGFALLASASVQECHDMAAIAQMATLRSRVPFVHFFDGFRTSHELNTMTMLSDDELRTLVPEDAIRDHRRRALSPGAPLHPGHRTEPGHLLPVPGDGQPVLRGHPRHRQHRDGPSSPSSPGGAIALVEYLGDPEAERVVVVMGSGAQTVAQTVEHLRERGERVGMVQVRLYRPFPTDEILAAIPASCTRLAVLDRTKEPGAGGEPLFLDVVSALGEAVGTGRREPMPRVTGGRYGLSSKEFTPGMVQGIFDELALPAPRPRFTVGITDDVSHLSLPFPPT